MSKPVLGTLAASIVFAVSVGNVEAITFGEPDGDAHPHVGVILFVQDGVGYYSCTGTLISPTLVLTAGHCTEGASGEPNDVTYVRFSEDALEGRADYRSAQKWLDREWIEAEAIPHPQYDDFSEFPLTYDVGLVRLKKPVRSKTYGILPEEGFLDAVLAEQGQLTNSWTAVGYGLQGVINPFYGDDFARYSATMRLIELNSYFDGDGQSAKFSNNPGNDTGGTCFGDSGGPIFYEDTPIIGAVVSFGITPCIGIDYDFRMDTPTALDFVNEHLRR